MKLIFFFVLSLLIPLNHAISQNPQFADVKPNGITQVFTSWPTAYAAAVNGDFIYLPGILIPDIMTVNKKLFIFGSGLHPDSCSASGRTKVDILKILGGAGGGTIEGIQVNQATYLGSTESGYTTKLQNYTLKRCSLGGVVFNSLPDSLPEFITISESLVSSVSGAGNPVALNCYFYKNIIFTNIFHLGYCTFKNNIFANGDWVMGDINYTLFENNIFLYPSPFIPSLPNCFNTFLNNLKVGVANLNSCESTQQGTILVPSVDDIFILYNPSNSTYINNYHLLPGCPGIGAGTDGTDVGIYGTNNPTPVGWIPSNPHIYFKQVDAETGADGKLHIKVGVRTNN
ncbi:MAG: hypothetical protein ABI761_06730 [Saprospiraceae bacterium]